jgi:ribosome production factor 2
MKKPNSKMFGRKNDLNPFDDETGIEFLTTKNDSSLFLFGSHNKKRPHNIVMVSAQIMTVVASYCKVRYCKSSC